jgi:hypothetical protein
MIGEMEEEPEPNIFNFNMLEVSWVESVSTEDVKVEVEVEMEFELELEEDDDNEDDEEEDNEEENDERSIKLDFTNVDTKDKLAAPSPCSSWGVVEGDEVREKEVEGVLDMISVFVWGIEETMVERELGESLAVEIEREVEVAADFADSELERELEMENDSGWILVRSIELTESTAPWPATTWPATKSVKLVNTTNHSAAVGEEEREEEGESRAWIVATVFNESNISFHIESYDTFNDCAWFNVTASTFNTESLESRDNSDGDRVTDDKEVKTDNIPPSLTSLSSVAKLNKPNTIRERISRISDMSEDDIPQSSPE